MIKGWHREASTWDLVNTQEAIGSGYGHPGSALQNPATSFLKPQIILLRKLELASNKKAPCILQGAFLNLCTEIIFCSQGRLYLF